MTTAAQEVDTLVARHAPGLLHFTDTEIAPLYLRGLTDAGFDFCTPIQAQTLTVALQRQPLPSSAVK